MAQRVIVIAGKDPTLIDGGMEAYLRAYGRAAIAAGYEPHHFCVSDRTDTETTAFGIVHRAWSPVRPFRGLMVAAHQAFVVRSVDRFLGSSSGRHLIHSFGPWSGVGVAVASRLRKRGIEPVTLATTFGTYHHETLGKLQGVRHRGSIWLRAKLWWEFFLTCISVDPSERRGYLGSEQILMNYQSVQDIITKQFGSGIRFRRTTYCSEAAHRADRDIPDDVAHAISELEPRDAPLIVSVSRHDPRKGLDVLLQALALLRQQGIPFRACLVGGGQLLETHRRLAESLGLGRSVMITGRVPDAYAYLKLADVFVLPSLEEGSGSVSLLEAMQARASPVVSRIDGLPEDVTHDENALLVEPNNSRLLADALARLCVDEGLRARIAGAAHQQYLARFSAQAFSSDITAVYSSFGFPPDGGDESQLSPKARSA